MCTLITVRITESGTSRIQAACPLPLGKERSVALMPSMEAQACLRPPLFTKIVKVRASERSPLHYTWLAACCLPLAALGRKPGHQSRECWLTHRASRVYPACPSSQHATGARQASGTWERGKAGGGRGEREEEPEPTGTAPCMSAPALRTARHRTASPVRGERRRPHANNTPWRLPIGASTAATQSARARGGEAPI